MTKDYDSTLARITGNILAGLVEPVSDRDVNLGPHTARNNVALAEAFRLARNVILHCRSLATVDDAVVKAARDAMPRCKSCQHWKTAEESDIGVCMRVRAEEQDSKMWAEKYDYIKTAADFGCVQWEARR